MEEPITRTFFGPFAIVGWALTWAIHSWTCASQPAGCAVTQTKPRTLGLITIELEAFAAGAVGASFNCRHRASPGSMQTPRFDQASDQGPMSTIGPSALGTPPLRSRLTANLATVWTGRLGWKIKRPSPVVGSTLKTPPSTGMEYCGSTTQS